MTNQLFEDCYYSWRYHVECLNDAVMTDAERQQYVQSLNNSFNVMKILISSEYGDHGVRAGKVHHDGWQYDWHVLPPAYEVRLNHD
jgi:hypothetical protein